MNKLTSVKNRAGPEIRRPQNHSPQRPLGARTRAELETLAARIAALKLEEVSPAAELDARLRLAREQLEPRLA